MRISSIQLFVEWEMHSELCLAIIFLWAEMFFASSQNVDLWQGCLSSQKWTKPKKLQPMMFKNDISVFYSFSTHVLLMEIPIYSKKWAYFWYYANSYVKLCRQECLTKIICFIIINFFFLVRVILNWLHYLFPCSLELWLMFVSFKSFHVY